MNLYSIIFWRINHYLKKARDVVNKVLLKIEALREPAIAWRSRLAIAILLVTFL
jgi:hypothetical protein